MLHGGIGGEGRWSYIDPMSKAFTKESDDDGAAELPERIVSTHPNLVTPEGLAAIEAEIARWTAAYAEAVAGDDRDGVNRAARELRYWTSRSASAQVAPAPDSKDDVRFGSTVTVERADGRRSTWRIVGEDEADPANGTLSHAAPVARAMLGKGVGEEIAAGAFEGEIVEIVI